VAVVITNAQAGKARITERRAIAPQVSVERAICPTKTGCRLTFSVNQPPCEQACDDYYVLDLTV
jgi:hypothetical protein